MTIKELKAEARERLQECKYDGWSNFGKRDLTPEEEWFNNAMNRAIRMNDALIDKVADAIEASVNDTAEAVHAEFCAQKGVQFKECGRCLLDRAFAKCRGL